MKYCVNTGEPYPRLPATNNLINIAFAFIQCALGSTMNLIYYNPRPVNREPNRWAMKILVDLTHADVTLSHGMVLRHSNRARECINKAKFKSELHRTRIYICIRAQTS